MTNFDSISSSKQEVIFLTFLFQTLWSQGFIIVDVIDTNVLRWESGQLLLGTRIFDLSSKTEFSKETWSGTGLF